MTTVGTAMTLTIAPDDTLQCINAPLRLRTVSDTIRQLLYNTLGHQFQYELYPEVSYPQTVQEGKGGRIHFHGIIYFKPSQKTEFYVEHLHKLSKHCRIEIDSIVDIKKWREYIEKDRHEMEAYCLREKVVYQLTEQLPLPTAPRKIEHPFIKR